MKPIIVALLASLLFLAACGDSGRETATPTPPSDTPAPTPAAQTPTEEPAQETPTPTEPPPETAEPTEPPGGAGGGGLEGTVVPITTPFPSPEPVPDEWATYTDPRGRFTVRYPSTWELETAGEQRPPGVVGVGDISVVSFFSYDRSEWTQPYFPPNSVKVEVFAASLEADLPTCQPEDSSSPRALGGVPGWEVLTVYDTAVDYPGLPDESNFSRSHQVAADHVGYRFCLVAHFTGADPDETTFLQIASSFQFSK